MKKNLFQKLRYVLSSKEARNKVLCEKEKFCDCSFTLDDVCLSCPEKKKLEAMLCKEWVDSPAN